MRLARLMGWTLALPLVAASVLAGPAAAQSPSPSHDASEPVGLVAVVPTRIGGVDLAVESYRPDEMRERMQASDDALMSTLRAVLTGPDGMLPPLSSVVASSADPEATERYEIIALHVPGRDAETLLNDLFRELAADQIRASGVDDPEEIERMTAGFEALIPWRKVGGREVASPDDGQATTFELIYPHEEVLFLIQGEGGLSMADLLSVLP